MRERCGDSPYDDAGNVIDTHEQTGEFKESGAGAESGVV